MESLATRSHQILLENYFLQDDLETLCLHQNIEDRTLSSITLSLPFGGLTACFHLRDFLRTKDDDSPRSPFENSSDTIAFFL